MNHETLPPTAVPSGVGVMTPPPDFAPPAPPGPPPGEPSRVVRRLLIAGAGVLALAGIAVAALVLAGSTPHRHKQATPQHLTGSQIASIDSKSTLMVVARGDSALANLTGRSNLLGTGSAWVLDASRGLIVTNAHVVADATSVQAGFDKQTLTDVTVEGLDIGRDMAVLKVPSGALPGLRTLPRAVPGSVHQGDTAYALGYSFDGNGDFLKTPLQLSTGSISAVSGVSITVSTDPFEDNENAGLLQSPLYQTDAAINPGNSGGPLVNSQGQLIGMNSAAMSQAHTIGYAIPIDTIDSVVPTLAAGNSKEWLGFGFVPMTPQLADKLDIPGGLFITSVAKDTPAEQAGLGTWLANGLVILYNVNGRDVTSTQEYVDTLKGVQSGEAVKLRIVAIDGDGNAVGRTISVTMP